MDCILLTVSGFTFLLNCRSVERVVPIVFSLTQRWDCLNGKAHYHRWLQLRLRSSQYHEALALKTPTVFFFHSMPLVFARWKFLLLQDDLIHMISNLIHIWFQSSSLSKQHLTFFVISIKSTSLTRRPLVVNFQFPFSCSIQIICYWYIYLGPFDFIAWIQCWSKCLARFQSWDQSRDF